MSLLYGLWNRRRRKLKRGGDSTGPALTGLTPAADAVNVEPSASISLTVADSESAVVIGTLDVTVDGVAAVTDGVVVAPFNGTGSSCTQVGNNVAIVLVPTNEFQYRAVKTVGVYATSSGGVLNTTYTFTVRDVTAMVSFNGSDEYLGNSDGLTATLGGASAMTLSVWSRTDADTSGSVVSNSNESSQNMFSILAQNNVRSIQVRIPTSVSSEAEYANVFAGEVGYVTWRHIVVRFDGTQADNAGRLRVWVNGIERTGDHIAYTGTIPATLASPSVGFGVSRYGGASSLYDTAYHGHVAVWNSALSTGDISTLFGDGRITNPNALATKPIHFWRCDSTDDLVNADGVVDRGSSATKRHMTAYNMDAANAVANVPPQIREVITPYTWTIAHRGADHTHSSWPASVGTLTLTPTAEANQWTQDVSTPWMRASACPAGVHNEGLYRHATSNNFELSHTYPSNASLHIRHIGYLAPGPEGTTSHNKMQWKRSGANDSIGLRYTNTTAYGAQSQHATADGGQFGGGTAQNITTSVIEPDGLARPVLWDAFYIYDPDADTWTMQVYVNGFMGTKYVATGVTSHPFSGDTGAYTLTAGLADQYAWCWGGYRIISDTYDPDAFRAEHMRDLYSLGG